MELVVGASEATMRSLLGKLGALLAQEYSLIRGVHGDLQYINDELASMQSFLRDLSAVGDARGQGHDHRMKDWMKQIRDITYDIEDCVDDSAHRLHGLRTDMCCYFLVNSVYEILTWGPRRDISTKISNLKLRAQQIGERRHRYGVDNPNSLTTKASPLGASTTGFDAADNQDTSLQLVTIKDPVGVEEDMGKLEKWLTNEDNNRGVLSIVGFGGVGKTAIATALYRKFGNQFDRRAMVTVSQSSDLEAILTNIKSQVMQQSSRHDQQGGSEEKSLAAAVKGVLGRVSRGASVVMAKCGIAGTSEETQGNTKLDQHKKDPKNNLEENRHDQQGGSEEKSLAAAVNGVLGCVSRGTSAVMAKCGITGTSEERQGNTKLDQLKEDLKNNLEGNSSLFLIDDVWSATTWDNIKKSFDNFLPRDKRSRIIVTTRFQAVGTTCKREQGDMIHKVGALGGNKPKKLFEQALSESKGTKDNVPENVWKMCGGLPLAIVTIAGHVACNPNKSENQWLDLCRLLVAESEKDLTKEELGRIVSHCYNDMPAEIKTCSLYLSIFPKGHKISRKRLMRRWIAEGFVSEKQGLSVEDVAETYFNHLIRRKIIRPVEHSSNGKVKNCVVHDMVLEHIVAKASEENFITVVGGHYWLMHLPSSNVRRLSLQGSDSKHAKDMEKMNLSHVRSLTMFGSLNQLPPHLFKFGIVRVLDLEGCTGFKQHHTKEICKMLLLKYFSLRGTDTKRLPKTIGKLENLETLDIRETNIVELPKTVCQLERLVNILGGDKNKRKALKLPEEMKKKKKMKALRILLGIEIVGGSADFHHLTELRKLAIYKLNIMGDDSSFKDLSSSIEYLGGNSLQTLVIDDESSKFLKSLDGLSTPPKFLVALELSGKMVKLPQWIRELDALKKLTLSVTAFRKDNLSHLSYLKALFSLTFSLSQAKQDSETLTILAENKLFSDGEIIVPAGGFKELKLLRFSVSLLPLLSFSEEAMPKLERLELEFDMLEGLFGAENLAGLEEVHLKLKDKEGEVMTKKIEREIESAMLKREESKRPRVILNK